MIQRALSALPPWEHEVQAFRGLTESIPALYTQYWLQKVINWENDPTKASNPFELACSRMSSRFDKQQAQDIKLYSFLDIPEKSIHAELVKEDASSLYRTRAVLTKDDVTINEVIVMGLDLEEEQ